MENKSQIELKMNDSRDIRSSSIPETGNISMDLHCCKTASNVETGHVTFGGESVPVWQRV